MSEQYRTAPVNGPSMFSVEVQPAAVSRWARRDRDLYRGKRRAEERDALERHSKEARRA